jgi:2'-5' RNA ligase
MRMFVAIELDDRVRTSAFALRAAADEGSGASFRRVNPHQAHLTLAFLGEVLTPRSEQIIAAMREPIEGVYPFRLAFGGLGAFPPRGAPRVLWLGVSEGERDVLALQRLVVVRLEALGVTLEDRAFHPHLTIGRWKQSRPSDRPRWPADAPSTPGMTVDHVTLFESRLSSEGPTHLERARAPLGTPESS